MTLVRRMAWLALLPLLWGAGAEALLAEDSRRPNILVIVADDLGYGDLGIHGGKDIPTPHIDGLANSGVRCTSGYVSGPYCSPTRAGLLTGRYQQRFGHEFNPGGGGTAQNQPEGFGLPLDQVTFADRLKSAGYATGMVGKWHLGATEKFHPLKRGFTEYFGFLGGAHPYFPGATPQNPVLRGMDVVAEPEYLTDAFTREALAYIDRHREHPFFLYLTYNAVHSPMQAPPDLLEKFASITDERRRKYAGMLSSMDSGVGQVLAKLRETGLEKHTLVFFVSDNGGPPGNGSKNTPLNGQKATTWEGGVRVPYFVSWPGTVPAGKTYDHPVIQLDILPTALAAAQVGVPSDARLDGVNLLPFLKGDNTAAPHEALYWRFGEQIALRKGDWKLLKVRGDAQPRLYNLIADISEQKDLASEKPDLLKELQGQWDQWNATLEDARWTPAAQRPGRQKKKAARQQ